MQESPTHLLRFASRAILLISLALLLTSCETPQARFSSLGSSFPPQPKDYPIEVFETGLPGKPFTRVSRLDVNFEKTFFVSTSLKEALPELKRQARLSGADAIIEIDERKSMVGETKIYHVTATGIRFTESGEK
jgi:hypothetical protein